MLATNRLSELEEAQEENISLSKQLEGLQVSDPESRYVFLTKNHAHDILFLQNELNDDKYVRSSRLYTMLNDQLQHWNAELERYRALIDALQVKLPCLHCLQLHMVCFCACLIFQSFKIIISE